MGTMGTSTDTERMFHYMHNDYWMIEFTGGMKWDSAEAMCNGVSGGHLASFHSDMEYTEVRYGLQSLYDGKEARGWIGLKYDTAANQFLWQDGSYVNFTYFAPGQPVDLVSPNLCIETMKNYPFWSNSDCYTFTNPTVPDQPMSAICKRAAPPPPPPPVADIYNSFDGTCAKAYSAPTEELRHHFTMLCSQGIFCRERNNWNGPMCDFHCQMFPASPICTSPSRKLLAVADEEAVAPLLDTEQAQELVRRTINAAGRKLRMV